MMSQFLNKSNLTKAGIAAVAALLASNLTASRGKLMQGAAVLAAIAVALPLSAKVA